jgi:NADH-quinone oxidoreductase subunit N
MIFNNLNNFSFSLSAKAETNSNSFLSDSLSELQSFWNQLPGHLGSPETPSKIFWLINKDFLSIFNINVYSYSMLMVLILIFIRNYASSSSSDLVSFLEKAQKTILFLLFASLVYSSLISDNSTQDNFSNFSTLFVLLLAIGLLHFTNTLSVNKGAVNFILLSFTVVCLSWTMLGYANNDFALLLICLEGFSLSLYIMATMERTFGGIAASTKYFAFGTAGSILMLWGGINFYELLGSLNSVTIVEYINNIINNYSYTDTAILIKVISSSVLIVVGLLIKLGAAPTHQWVPDVYSGVPLLVTAFYSLTVKLVLFVLFLEWAYILNTSKELEFAAVLSIIIGCIGTLRQTEIKRFLAYGSITHMGYLLIGDVNSAWIYLFGYMLASFVFFSVLLNLRLNGRELVYLSDLRYVGQSSSQWDRIVLVLALSSMAGLPPFAGFYGKMLVWMSLIEDIYLYNDLLSSATLLVNLVTSLFVIFYYIRVMAILFVNDEEVKHDYMQSYQYDNESLINLTTETTETFEIANVKNKYMQWFVAALISFWTFVMPVALTVSNSLL